MKQNSGSMEFYTYNNMLALKVAHVKKSVVAHTCNPSLWSMKQDCHEFEDP